MATAAGENTPLLDNGSSHPSHGLLPEHRVGIASTVASGDVKSQGESTTGSVGERLAYNDYTTIDWMYDLVRDSYRLRTLRQGRGLRHAISVRFDAASGWIAAALVGTLTACVAYLVDVAVATVSDWKLGYCKTNPLSNREACCSPYVNLSISPPMLADLEQDCPAFHPWARYETSSYTIYVCMALVFGVISGSVTMLTKAALPAVLGSELQTDPGGRDTDTPSSSGKTLYMAAGSGIPEIKTILSGFVIPHFLDLKVLLVKAVASIFAVSTGMCLGKEGPFVHISTCVGYLVARRFHKYRVNGRKMREMLSAACAAGLSVAFGAPIGGVLFSYEEISTYFPRKIMWRAFLCSLCAAVVLRALNPTGTGKLVLFETNYGTSYNPIHYLIFVSLGVSGGIFGGLFCKLNYLWSKWFRSFALIKKNPVFEVFVIVAITAMLQYPNPMLREPGDIVVKQLLVDCRSHASSSSWVCRNEADETRSLTYFSWLVHGTFTKLFLTTITFGIKVPSGVIIPALDGGALFGRLVGLWIGGVSPGIFAMVGAGAFLAGVSRMTISLVVVMFELTGDLEYVLPHMIAILVAKWTADMLSNEGVYDLAQSVLGHPFLDNDHALSLVQSNGALTEDLIPPRRTMEEITLHVPLSDMVPKKLLEQKLQLLERRGLMDSGLVVVRDNGQPQGYIGQTELSHGLRVLGCHLGGSCDVRILGDAQADELDLSVFVDRTPFSLTASAPMEYCVEMFGKLGLKHVLVVEDATGKLAGVIIKKRLVAYLDALKMQH